MIRQQFEIIVVNAMPTEISSVSFDGSGIEIIGPHRIEIAAKLVAKSQTQPTRACE